MVRGRGSMRDTGRVRRSFTNLSISWKVLRNCCSVRRSEKHFHEIVTKDVIQYIIRLMFECWKISQHSISSLFWDVAGPETLLKTMYKTFHLKEEKNRGKPNWEHLNDELHVLIQCEDTPNRAHLKLKGAVSEIKKLLIPAVHFLLLFALISMLSQQLFSGLKTSYSLMARKHERSTLRWIALLDCGYPVKNFRWMIFICSEMFH